MYGDSVGSIAAARSPAHRAAERRHKRIELAADDLLQRLDAGLTSADPGLGRVRVAGPGQGGEACRVSERASEPVSRRLRTATIPDGPTERSEGAVSVTQGPPVDHDAVEHDGYFPPGSVTRTVIGDPAALIGGISALFLQPLHPRAMAGVEQHSSFPDDFWPRLQRTAGYVTTLAFADRATADRAVARVRGIHRRVHGIDPITGAPYSADDPDLLRWVHVTEVSSLAHAAHRLDLIDDAGQDAFLAEQVRAGALLGGRRPAGQPGRDRRLLRRGASRAGGQPAGPAGRPSAGASPRSRCAGAARPVRCGRRWPRWRSGCCRAGPSSSTGCRRSRAPAGSRSGR